MSLKQNHDLVDLAVRIIDYHIGQEIPQTGTHIIEEVSLVINQFNKRYTRASSVPQYNTFDTCGDSGIPRLVQYFTSFDPINATGPFSVWTNYTITPTDLESRHVYRYLTAPEFSRGLLCSNKYDRVVNAIFSYLLMWTKEGLLMFSKLYPTLNRFVLLIIMEKDRVPVYAVPGDRVPFVRSAFRMLTHFFNGEDSASAKIKRPQFSVKSNIPHNLIVHFKQVYAKLLTESLTRDDIRLIESRMTSPFASTALKFSGMGDQVNIKSKVITGQACCGKTTLLESLKTYGWSVCSRGFLGTFSGKSKSAASIAGLHAALESALRRGDVLGDRGAIDNPLWSIIMPLCDPKYKYRVVEELIEFFNSTLNEHVIAYMYNQQVVVFVDPYPSKNRERMLKRCTGGDAFRARIQMYPITQFIAYYMAARLFGWTVRCVPYDYKGEFQPKNYLMIADEIKILFGKPMAQEPLGVASKPVGNHLEDKEYAVATGIYK